MSSSGCPVASQGTTEQVIVVKAHGTRATVTACQWVGDRYRRSHGPYPGHVGRAGVAPAGRKREGDGRTPAGTFRLRSAFGAGASPGLRIRWFTVGSRDVWVDDPRSAVYNTHRLAPAHGRWRSAERLDITAYRYAQVIGYNEAAVPGRGSAIFLHIDSGRPTAGCVSVSRKALVSLLRWQRTGAVIRIS